jgi:hypothetical protein
MPDKSKSRSPILLPAEERKVMECPMDTGGGDAHPCNWKLS